MTRLISTVRAADRFAADPGRSYTLPARYYYDPEIYEREKEAIFYRSWQFVGHAEKAANPGDYVTFKIHDQNVLIIRGQDGALRAFYNVCSYRAHELLEGAGNVEVITCPYHGWTYELDGRLRSARGSEKVEDFDAEEFCLKEVLVEVFLNFVFINLDRDARSLKSQTGTLEDEVRGFLPELDKLTFAHRTPYDLKANWKNVIENFNECYHCPLIHPTLSNDILQMSSYRIVTHDIHLSHRSRAKPPEDGVYDFDPKVSEHGQELGAWWLWPNIAFEVYPGGYLNTFHVMPAGPERSLKYLDFYLFDKTPTEEQQKVIDYRNATVELEDVAVVESVQRGLRSRAYRQGRLMVNPERNEDSEHALHHIQRLVLDALGR